MRDESETNPSKQWRDFWNVSINFEQKQYL